jgi:D-3-phosphoglycerate dehydrogenase / 2-oxoglutarate reductase
MSAGRGEAGARFRVVVTDHAFPDLDTERAVVEAAGGRIDDVQRREPGDLAPLVADADALLVQFATIDEEVVRALRRCRVIVRYGIGVDGVDVAAATARGIPVVNVPDYALDEVADHAMSLVLAVARRLPEVSRRVRDGEWVPNPCRPMRSLRGRTLGLAGFGAIARRIAARAAGFGLRLQAFDPYVAEEVFAEHGVTPVDWEQFLRSSEVISVHLPLTEATRHLFDAAAFGRMGREVLFVNTSRGAVVETGSLLAALDDGTVAAAGLDVLEEEPPGPDAPIVMHPRALVTSHCAWYTEESLRRLQRLAAEEVARALRGERPRHVINPEAIARE